MKVTEKLASLLKLHGLPLTEVALQSGVSYRTIMKIMHGEDCNLQLETVEALLKVLDYEVLILQKGDFDLYKGTCEVWAEKIARLNELIQLNPQVFKIDCGDSILDGLAAYLEEKVITKKALG